MVVAVAVKLPPTVTDWLTATVLVPPPPLSVSADGNEAGNDSMARVSAWALPLTVTEPPAAGLTKSVTSKVGDAALLRSRVSAPASSRAALLATLGRLKTMFVAVAELTMGDRPV